MTVAYLNLFRFIPGYQTHITEAHKEPLVLLLLAFLITFVLTRLYTRLARIRGWGSGSVHGVHLHHMVVGIVIVLLAGLAAVASGPDTSGHGRDLIGIFFGVGAALLLDEFALFSPLGIHEEGVSGRWAAFGVIALNCALALITFLKGKLALGLLSVFVPLLGLIGAIRLAKPTSPWAKWFYGRQPSKLERARARYAGESALNRFNDWLTDLIGGAPTAPPEEPNSPS